ncbi:MAG TPA: aldehyde dehydrogenase family protein, partial [Candidatus Limnocylindria bacterium]|nr:aldehyde dehydrogenase family protein [Candidatus Limnocylindria bacterium]
MAVGSPAITSTNPATDEILASFPPHTAEQVEEILAQAQDAFVAWRQRSIADRAVPMRRLAGVLRERADRYARLASLEMGKPITE